MFKNKNWFKVLVPEIALIVLVMTVFFACRLAGMKDENAVGFAALAAGFIGTALITGFAVIIAFAAGLIAFTATNVAFVAARASSPNFFTVNTDFATAVIIAFAAGFIGVLAAGVAAQEYKLPKFWVFVSYLVEAIVIFLPIYFFSLC